MRQSGLTVRQIAEQEGIGHKAAYKSIRLYGESLQRLPDPSEALRGVEDFTGRPGPIRCICGAPTPHAPRNPLGSGSLETARAEGIPWGFCSQACRDEAEESFASLIVEAAAGGRR
jgi:hypothetical protein